MVRNPTTQPPAQPTVGMIWNRTPQRAEALVAAGARRARSPREVAAQAAVTITMLSDTPDVEAVYRAPEGVLAGVDPTPPGPVLVDMSTIAPRAARACGRSRRARCRDA
jgi:3-hydroxyisobutyrate dehydrogenase-like beta-hydroxyacid dehydrogenase